MNILLRDKYAAVTVAAALLSDRLQDPSIPPADADQLKYLLDVLLELQTEFGSQLNQIKTEVSDETIT